MFKKIYFGFIIMIGLVFIYLVFITFKPIRSVEISDVDSIIGFVENAEINEEHLNIKLKDDPHYFYIKPRKNKDSLFSKIINSISEKRVKLYYINKWTPLTRDGVYPHISRIVVDGKFIFNEIKE